jgi:thiosulfate/3-mercaptopyruvate sulfurtransferase
LGIDRADRLVIYARGPLGGMLHAARAWHLFRVYGHENVSVLNGGLDAWRRADLPATDAAPPANGSVRRKIFFLFSY